MMDWGMGEVCRCGTSGVCGRSTSSEKWSSVVCENEMLSVRWGWKLITMGGLLVSEDDLSVLVGSLSGFGRKGVIEQSVGSQWAMLSNTVAEEWMWVGLRDGCREAGGVGMCSVQGIAIFSSRDEGAWQSVLFVGRAWRVE